MLNKKPLQLQPTNRPQHIHQDNLHHFVSALGDCNLEDIAVHRAPAGRSDRWKLMLEVTIKPDLNPKFQSTYQAEMYIRPAATIPDRKTSRTIRQLANKSTSS